MDLFSEVMIRYCLDIDAVAHDNPQVYTILDFQRQDWLQPMFRGIEKQVEHKVIRLDTRAAFRRLCEILLTGHSDIDPVKELITLTDHEKAQLTARGAMSSMRTIQ